MGRRLPTFAMPSACLRASKTSEAPTSPTSCAPRPASELVILGSGVSTALPRISCVLRGRLPEPGQASDVFLPCAVCTSGLANPFSRNRRCNVSALVRLGECSIMIDCGKTAREACMRHLPSLGVKTVEAVVLTHGHADAILGLDDLRDIQAAERIDASALAYDQNPTVAPTPVYLNEKTMQDVRNVFPYLLPKKPANPNAAGSKDIERRVAQIDWRVFEYFESFRPCVDVDVEFTPIPLIHGGDYIAAGFVIRGGFDGGSTVCYLSDVNIVPEDTMDFLKALPRIDVLLVDSLLRSKPHTSHFSLDQAIDLARQLKPGLTRCIGMTCSLGLHEEVDPELEALLESEGLDIRLGYDGLRLPL